MRRHDSVLERLEALVSPYKYHMSEQLDRNSGVEKSAVDLTWSYAEVLSAVYYREQM
jgi:GH15 family glucan-1,4-alpha-glucosidase